AAVSIFFRTASRLLESAGFPCGRAANTNRFQVRATVTMSEKGVISIVNFEPPRYPPLVALGQDFVALNLAFAVGNRLVTHDRDRPRNRFDDAQQLIAYRAVSSRRNGAGRDLVDETTLGIGRHDHFSRMRIPGDGFVIEVDHAGGE